jgi:hypothetical protein
VRRENFEEKEVKKVEKVITSKIVTCNKCGESRELKENGNWYDSDEDLFANDIHNFSLGFGYGSRFDMDHWDFDLCDNCLDSIIKTFKYPPDGFMEDGYGAIDNEEEKQKVFEYYKQTGSWNPLRFKSYEELVKLAGYYDYDYINEIIKEIHPDKPLVNLYDDEE